jgi:hypothetical protein
MAAQNAEFMATHCQGCHSKNQPRPLAAKAFDVLIALETHPPMSEQAICERLEITREMPGRELSGKPFDMAVLLRLEEAASAQLLGRRILVKTPGSPILQNKGKVSGRAKDPAGSTRTHPDKLLFKLLPNALCARKSLRISNMHGEGIEPPTYWV